MISYKECYDNQRNFGGRFRTLAATDISARGDNLLAVIARHAPNENDNHNTLITFLYKGDTEAFEKSIEKTARDRERFAMLQRSANLEDGQNVHAVQLHMYAGHVPAQDVRKKIKLMVDCLSNDGLIQASTAQELYTQLKLMPTPETPSVSEIRPSHARH